MNLASEHIGKKLLTLSLESSGVRIGLVDGSIFIPNSDPRKTYFKPYVDTRFAPLHFSGSYDIVCDQFYFIPGEPFESKGKTGYYLGDDPNNKNAVLASFDMDQSSVVSLCVDSINPILDWNVVYTQYENCFGSFYAIAPLLRKELGITRREQSEKYGYHVKSLSRLLTRYRKVWNIFELNREWVGQQKFKKV